MEKQTYKNTQLSPDERARLLLKEMSLEEKMAQLNSIFPFGEDAQNLDAIEAQVPYGIGQVSTLEMRRMKTLEEVVTWQREVQKRVMKHSPHQIPALFHMEGLCGAFIQDSTSFPSGIGRGSSWDPALEEEVAKVVSRQEAACGITHILAPVLDISRDSRMGRQGETYGEDPALAAAMGSAYTKGIQNCEVKGLKPESVAKHFTAFHNSQGGIHGTHSDTPVRPLIEIYGKPFQAAISEQNLRGIMPCYCSINGEPASASHWLLTKLLREDMGFDGLCVSDYGAIAGVYNTQRAAESLTEAGLICMEAGMDMELPNCSGYNEELKEMFRQDEADIKLLDQTVLRVLTAKFRMGLFERPFALQGEELKEYFYQEKDQEVALRSAKESLILLKNNGALPLQRNVKKIALIGSHADYARKFFGGYTHLCMMESTYAVANSIAGVSGVVQADAETIQTIPGTHIQSDETPVFEAILKRQKPNCKSLLSELQSQMPETEVLYAYGYPIAGADESRFEEALKIAKEADVILLTLGGKHGTCSMASMGEGVDGSNINLPPCQDAFLKKVHELGKPMIGVHFDGRPISSDVADEVLDAILECWNPSEMGAPAIVSALLGDYNPGGKLPVSVAYHAGQIPIYYNHPNGSAWHQGESIGFVNYVDLPHTPRYFFGHGLSYTTFQYEDLAIQTLDDSAVITCTVTNTGAVSGDEVVQLYQQDVFASMTRPCKELSGFCRIHLKPNEKKRITFKVPFSQMSFLDRTMQWKIEKGEIKVEIGSSSFDIRLRGSYQISENQYISGKDRSFYVIGRV